MWNNSILKNLVGKDVTKIALPVHLNEPLSFTQVSLSLVDPTVRTQVSWLENLGTQASWLENLGTQASWLENLGTQASWLENLGRNFCKGSRVSQCCLN